MHRTIGLAALLTGLALALPAWAQRAADPGDTVKEVAPLSLQTQLGSIPLVSPRALSEAARVRMVRITQLDGRAQIGETREIACPETGCQQMVSLVVDNAARAFLADIQFVGKGIYLALQPRSAAIAAVVEFRQGRPGPVFIRGNETGMTERQISFVTAPALSLRRIEKPADSRTLASGNVYTRKRDPDLVLRVEVEQAKDR